MFTGIAGAIAFSAVNGLPPEMTVGAGLYTDDVIGTCFVTGLLAGIFSLGGDVTALPFVYQWCDTHVRLPVNAMRSWFACGKYQGKA